MHSPEVWVAIGMAFVGAAVPLGSMGYLAWQDRKKRQNRRGFDEST
jgi:hypothetical protein